MKRRPNTALLSFFLSLVSFVTLLILFDPSNDRDVASEHSAVDTHLNGFALPLDQIRHIEVGNPDIKEDVDKIIALLKDAGVYSTLTAEELSSLPSWNHVEALYGQQPVIVGSERCAEYRETVKLEDRYVGIAGLFNTGTNLLDVHYHKNIKGIGKLWQVPWGKHRMPSVRLTHKAKKFEKYNPKNVFPVVIVRDPLAWMQSVCKNKYAINWRHHESHCPNLVPTEHDRRLFRELRPKDVIDIRVRYDLDKPGIPYKSLAHFWSQYYNEYLDADYPVMFVRFEDLVYQPKVILREIVKCVGGHVQHPLYYQVGSSKTHGSGSGFLHVLIKTANANHRLNNLTQADKEFAQEHFDPRIMDLFHYKGPLEAIPETSNRTLS